MTEHSELTDGLMKVARDMENLEVFSEGPTEPIAFEVNPKTLDWNFTPHYYPSDITQNSSNEMDKDGGKCGSQDVTLKKNKNREVHISGIILEERIPQIQDFMDYTQRVDLISPLAPNNAGMECFIKKVELGEKKNWNERFSQWMFDYSIDLISTGRDGFTDGNNAIVTEVMEDQPEPGADSREQEQTEKAYELF